MEVNGITFCDVQSIKKWHLTHNILKKELAFSQRQRPVCSVESSFSGLWIFYLAIVFLSWVYFLSDWTKFSRQPHEKQISCSPRGIIFCFLCQRPFRMMLPYTRTSLKRKKTLDWGFRRPCFIRRPCPIRIRPGLERGLPDGPNELSTAWIRSRFSLSNISISILVIWYLSKYRDHNWTTSSLKSLLYRLYHLFPDDAVELSKLRSRANMLCNKDKKGGPCEAACGQL